MAVSNYLNRAKMSVSGTPGIGTVTLNAAVSGYASFAEAGAVNATKYTYVLEDGNDFEIGQGTYTSSGTTFSRDTVYLSKISGTAGTSKMSATTNATIAVNIAKEDFGALATPGAGQIIQVVQSTLSTYSNLNTNNQIPLDDTIPQSTEGNSLLSVSITPRNSISKVKVSLSLAISGSQAITLFRGTTCIAAFGFINSGAGAQIPIPYEIVDSPATGSAITYSVRIGSTSSVPTEVNGMGGRLFGGASICTLIAEEVAG